jgi:hypothetical protein
MKTLEKLSAELDETEKDAAIIVDELPPNVRGGWATKVTEAKEALPRLKAQYRATLLRNAVAIFVNGDKAKVAAFAKLADEEGGIVVDASDLYTRLAKEVELTLGDQRSWGIHQVHKFHLALQEVMHDLGLNQLPMPSRGEMPLVPTFDDTVAHIRHVLRDAVGDELNSLYIEEATAKRARAIRYIGVMAPVLIVGAQPDEQNVLAKSFSKGRAKVVVKAEDEINKEYLTETLKRIRKK